MFKFPYFIFILCVINFVQPQQWYDGANFYQIYPRSFKDSDGDGLGDLQGIKSKLQYVKDLGIDGIWLSPIMKSPQADHGYDISDYRDIHYEFGTLRDFDELLEECRRLNLKLILDFVPNHSSDEHEWFKKSERREAGYEDFYIWRSLKVDSISNIPAPPTNWLSAFGGSAWRWSDVRQEMYYHMVHYKQPDLNYRNPKVVQEMKNVLTYWMEKGVDGFRIDAVGCLYEKINPDGSFPDEPRSYKENCFGDDDCYLNHIYVQGQNETYDMVYEWRKFVDDFTNSWKIDPKVLMTEDYAGVEMNQKYYGNATQMGSHIPFNFELIVRANINSTAEDYKNIIEEWLDAMPKNQMANWVLGNHDRSRSATRLGVERGDLLNIMIQTLPGVAITYMGEELLMEDVKISWEDTVDPAACSSNPDVYMSKSRDPVRTPFPWDDSKNAGFSSANKTWLPVGEKYKTVNVKAQENAENSHLKIFQRLTKIRKEPMFIKGNYTGMLSNNKNVYSYVRQFENKFAVIVLNFGKNEETVNLTALFPHIPKQLKIYTSSLASGLKNGESIPTSSIKIKSNMGVVLNSTASVISSKLLMIFSIYFVFKSFL